jgi:feruloyl esterase
LQVVSATIAPAGRFTDGSGQGFGIPASCRIVAEARPTADSRIGFELWLPEKWNGRYSQLGNGGFAGNIDQASLANEIRRGNAAAMTDTGHKASQFNASWALGHPEKIVDYGYRSIKVTADAAKWLIEDYYGRPAWRRYFIGCSNGGRQALMAAQRYPDDWDGIIAGSPPVEWTRQLATFAAIQHQLRASAANWIPAAKLPGIERAAIAACGPGRLSCRIDVRRLTCRTRERPDCLTAAQAATLGLIQSGPKTLRGTQIYAGFEPAGAAVPGNWTEWIVNPDPDAPSQLTFAVQAYRNLILDDPNWQIDRFTPARDLALASNRMIAGTPLSEILDPANPDLTAFRRHGGKLIMYVGSADAVVAPAAGANYYRRVVNTMGRDRARHFFRLFVIPGMQHCQGGLMPNAFGQAWVAPALRADPEHDIRLALEAWVERGREPRSLIAAKYVGDGKGNRLIATQRVGAYPRPAGAVTINRP